MTKPPVPAEAWQDFYNRFIEMNNEAWDQVDRRLSRECPPEKVDEIQEDFVAFTRFVWSNFIDLKLDFEEPVLERIFDVQGADALNSLGVKEENLDALRPEAAH